MYFNSYPLKNNKITTVSDFWNFRISELPRLEKLLEEKRICYCIISDPQLYVLSTKNTEEFKKYFSIRDVDFIFNLEEETLVDFFVKYFKAKLIYTFRNSGKGNMLYFLQFNGN